MPQSDGNSSQTDLDGADNIKGTADDETVPSDSTFDNKSFYGQIRYKEGKIIRQINILNNGLLVNDYSNDNQIENLLECLKGKKISTSYGILSKDEIINPLFL